MNVGLFLCSLKGVTCRKAIGLCSIYRLSLPSLKNLCFRLHFILFIIYSQKIVCYHTIAMKHSGLAIILHLTVKKVHMGIMKSD